MNHKDPSLTNGAAYFVDNKEYAAYLKEIDQYPYTQEEVRGTCSLNLLFLTHSNEDLNL